MKRLILLAALALLNAVAAFVSSGQNTLRPTTKSAPNPQRQLIDSRLQATKSSGGANVNSLLSANRATIDAMGKEFPDVPEITRLRFALAFSSQAEAKRALRESVAFRKGVGRSLVESAAKAYEEATSNTNGGWDNEAVRVAAPHAASINRFITPKNILTLSADNGDLIYVIRASLINDRMLMNRVTVKQMGEFFLYVKEIHNIVADARSMKSGRLCEVIFANDISGIRVPPDPRFSKALTESSKQYEKLYPSLAGPTMILNLPFVLQAFIGLIKPLFPPTVQDRLKFKSAPVLARLKELTPLSSSNDRSRKAFLTEIKTLL
uniref:CRAL-TRIO domain-containing protein n=1 Tax=Chaetoceros debilis TaxID=122233 RepID=A0A7S3PYR4_9STRA